jgi:tetratricopeptide (TPR) repeat protein
VIGPHEETPKRRLEPRDRALLEALQVYAAGDAPDTERRYRAILARYPDDLEAWLQLGEVLSHYGPVRGRPIAEAEAAWRKVLSYEPKNASAVVHLARIATAAGRSATLDSLLAPFAPAEIQTDRRLQQVAALRAIAQGDTATVRAIVQGAHDWEDAAAWQLAAYLTAFSPVPEGARFAVEGLIDPKRGPGMIADLQWFAALLHLENGQLAAARRARLETLTKKGSMWQYGTFAQVTDWWAATVPVPYADSTLDRIRRSASSNDLLLWNAKASAESRTADAVPLWFALVDEALGVPLRIEALRLYTIGAISLRLRDPDAANTASTALARLAAHEASDWFVRAFDHELRARRAWHAGRPDQALRILDQLELGPVPVGATNVVPFFAGAQLRYLRGELLVAVGRHAEALPWFESLGMLSVPESPFRGPAHLRQAEIHERLGNRLEAAKHYARVLELWRDADSEFQPLVEAARQRQAKLK